MNETRFVRDHCDAARWVPPAAETLSDPRIPPRVIIFAFAVAGASASPRLVSRPRESVRVMGWTSSSAMRAIDASPAESFDEASCRALVGDDAFDPEAWSEAKKDASGAVRKEDLLRTFGWPDEIFDGRAGSRADARAVNAAAESAAAGTPHFYELDPETTRRNRRALYVHSPRRESLDVSGADGRPVRFALWRPSQTRSPRGPRAVYLLFHGGGWVFGDAAGLNDERLEEMAETLGVVVLVPEYRKAPENPYPAPLDDCDAAAAWCEANAVEHFRCATDTLMMGGESAGGNLCAATLLRRKAAHDARAKAEGEDADTTGTAGTMTSADSFPWSFVNLVYGIYDVDGTPSVAAFGERRLVETARDLAYFADCYCPETTARGNPDVSPLFGDWDGWMPPAAFTVGAEDALVDDTLLLREKWRAAGCASTLDVWPEGPHGVGHFGVHAATDLGSACRRKILDRFRAFLGEEDHRECA